MLSYSNDVSAKVAIDFDVEVERNWRRDYLNPEPLSCELTLDGETFDLCGKDPAAVLEAMRRHLWFGHEAGMRDQAEVEMAEDYQEAAE